MKKRDYGVFHVALKILLRKKGKFLFLRSASGKHWDLPGGRIDNVEYDTPLAQVLRREVREELAGVKYKLGKAALQYRRFFEPRGIYIFITVFEADYLGGRIKLSDEHSSYAWIEPNRFKLNPKEFFSKEEYLAFRRYFEDTKKYANK